jgi:glutamine amidotransferase-like uncharacterized protein
VHFCLAHFSQVSRLLIVPSGLLALMITTGCGSSNWTASQRQTPPSVAEAAAAVATGASTTVPKVLLFVGTGTSSGDVSAVKSLLGSMSLSYATATTSQLNAMSETALRAYKLIFVPGGDAVTISKYLTRTATTNIHNAIVNGGVHYLGICAGGFFAGHSTYNYLSLTSNVWFNFYADEFKGITKAALEILSPNGTRLDQYWQNGPKLSGWGAVVGKYPDGTPAVVEGKSGLGWVILCGMHPEAPASWRYGMSFTTSVAADNSYAKTLVTAALNGTVLPHF